MTRRPRVALVSEHASPLTTPGGVDAGGQNVYVAALASELGDLGCDVTVHTRRDGADLPERVRLASGVELRHVDAGPPAALAKDELFTHMPAFALRLRQQWLADPPDLVHAHFWMSGWAAVTAAVGVPIVQTFHALGVVKQRHQAAADTSPSERQRVEAQLVHDADHVIATCSDEVRELRAIGCAPERISVVPCGIDPELFRPHGPIAPMDRANGTTHRLLVLGRLVPRKGVDDVIRALGRLPYAELVVAGGPPAGQLDRDAEVARLRDLARRGGVGDRVRFLGAVPRAEVPALIRAADLLVSAPWYEPFGITPIEAMACGRPVVGTAVGGLLDTVVPGHTGLLVPPRQPEALADALARLLENPSLRTRMGDEGAARVRQHFTWHQVACSTLDTYHGIGAAWATRAVPA